jgi:cytochrome c556
MRHTRPILAALWLLSLGGLAAAQDSEAPEPLTPEEAHEVREAHMKIYGAQLGILGPMAQGAAPYDAAAAQAAADAILANATSEDWLVMWPEGSAQGEVPDSRALPLIWEQAEDFEAKHQALVEAATALQAAAGTDLGSLQAALGGVGQSCGSCHETYRASEE